MLTRWNDFDRTFGIQNFATLDALRRRMDRLFDDYATRDWDENEAWATTAWPKVNWYDEGAQFVLVAQVPGLSEKDIQITANQDGVTISGERKAEELKAYSVHRQERSHAAFSRSFTFPTKVDVERSKATVKDGLLTLTLPKAAEVQPRKISIKAE